MLKIVARNVKMTDERGRDLKGFRKVDRVNTQKRHLSFVDKIYRGRKRPMAQKKSIQERQIEGKENEEGMAKPFKKHVVLKESTQEFLDRAADEHRIGGKISRRTKQKVTIMQDGSECAQKTKKGKAAKKISEMANVDGDVKLQPGLCIGESRGVDDSVGPLQVLDLNVPCISVPHGIHAAPGPGHLQMVPTTHNVHTTQWNLATTWLQSGPRPHRGKAYY